MEKTYQTSEDLIVRFYESGILASNIFARVHFLISMDMFELFSYLNRGRTTEEINSFVGAKGLDSFSLTSKTTFSLGKCLLDNPDNFSKDYVSPEVRYKTIQELLDFLEENFLIYSDKVDYLDRFGLQKSILDKKRLGNFHQQIGKHALLKLKTGMDDWWVKQKFLDDLSGIRETPYQFVQENFINTYFTEDRLNGKKFLDIGCGIGYYDKLFADRGASVLAVDTNNDHIKRAGSTFVSKKLEFKYLDINGGALGTLPKNSFDIVFLSDVLLFYFVNPNPKVPTLDVTDFLRQINVLLNEAGHLYILEPHGVFFLQSRLNSNGRPYAVLTEYRSRVFRVSPTLEELAQAVSRAGFLIQEIREVYSDAHCTASDVHAYRFCSEFPQWWFFSLVKKR